MNKQIKIFDWGKKMFFVSMCNFKHRYATVMTHRQKAWFNICVPRIIAY